MPTDEITRHLQAWGEGDSEAVDRLFPLVYQELRRLARRRLAGQPDGTLSTTALVHEAYLKLVDQPRARVSDRNHFYALVSRVMRQILVDTARRRGAQKRGGPQALLSLDEERAPGADPGADLLAIDEALDHLARLDPRLARTVELRFLAGLSVEEAATVLEVSVATVGWDDTPPISLSAVEARKRMLMRLRRKALTSGGYSPESVEPPARPRRRHGRRRPEGRKDAGTALFGSPRWDVEARFGRADHVAP